MRFVIHACLSSDRECTIHIGLAPLKAGVQRTVTYTTGRPSQDSLCQLTGTICLPPHGWRTHSLKHSSFSTHPGMARKRRYDKSTGTVRRLSCRFDEQEYYYH